MITLSSIIKELPKEQFENLGENTVKYITFLVPIPKELANGKTVKCKTKFINSKGFMANLLRNLANNLTKGLHKAKCKDSKSVYLNVKDNLLIFSCLNCKKKYEEKSDEYLAKRSENTLWIL